MTNTPTDPRLLRAEIAQTRADLGDTAAALMAKTDVKARAKKSAADAIDDVKAKVNALTGHAGGALGHARDRVSTGVGEAKDSVVDADVTQTMRGPVPVAVLGGAVGLILTAVAVLIWRRRR